MIDPLSEVIALLRPRTVFSKGISGAGRWARALRRLRPAELLRRARGQLPPGRRRPASRSRSRRATSCCCRRRPASPCRASSRRRPMHIDPKAAPAPTGEVRHGTRGGRPDVRLLGGYFVFDSPDAALLVSLLPALVHVRGVERLSTLVRLVGEESSERRPGRDLVLARLVEVLLIEALRSTPGEDAPPGLLRGLADARLAPAMRQMHGDPARPWTVAQLAKEAGAVALGVLRPLHARRRHAADGISARLAHGGRQGPAPPPTTSGSPRSPSASATARRARSAPRSAAMSAAAGPVCAHGRSARRSARHPLWPASSNDPRVARPPDRRAPPTNVGNACGPALAA